MAHLSRKDFAKMIELAKEGYRAGKKVENNIPFLDAYKKAHLHQKREEYDAFVAYRLYDSALRQANEAGEAKEEAFAQQLGHGLKELFVIEDPVFAAIDEINQRLKQLNSIWNWFNPARADIPALEGLKQTLLTQTEGTVEEAIDRWEGAKILNDKTVRFIAHLKREYGQESMVARGEVSREVKQKLYQPFLDYILSRTSWLQKIITAIFRKKDLSEEKLAFAQTVIEDVQDCSGSYGQLIDTLKTDQETHALISEHHGKKHYNLRERRGYIERPQPSTSSENGYGLDAYYYAGRFYARQLDVREGESYNRSELAEVFQDALEVKLN
ncbi:hypothetical protein [Legionella micdadei]|uniref:Uncharacterized protein n=1 Tax=Legionella micdadei TaxID=451 RepID=A0A098GAY0_LEGMI|nr:hypothetical protein [Legionella micdadei]ARG96418.1 hypothetical protein B6N58_01240 [Legionella micdadei]KTD29495.1 hypothetical protein Lmic_0567 [Legionella micdadei]CEG59623.1 protein of unknown function [Legionella micdadei]SCX95677.1 hypothetical protein SAMN02982997_00493 [Legionella micdadei]